MLHEGYSPWPSINPRRRSCGFDMAGMRPSQVADLTDAGRRIPPQKTKALPL